MIALGQYNEINDGVYDGVYNRVHHGVRIEEYGGVYGRIKSSSHQSLFLFYH